MPPTFEKSTIVRHLVNGTTYNLDEVSVRRGSGMVPLFAVVCDCKGFKRKGHCTHLMEGILNRVDVSPVEGVHLSTFEDAVIAVPIFFRPRLLTITVELGHGNPPTYFRKVELVVPDTLPDRFLVHELDLGYLPAGCARREIRQVFLEQLEGHWILNHESVECNAPQHSGGLSPHEHPEDFIKDGKLLNPLLYDYWLLLHEGMCMTCFDANGVPDI